tara:strand:- start:42 stop:2210 length:2169 start_codon:yes stop_codon:yes gene_type:complete
MAIIKTYPTKSTYYAGDKFLISDMQPDSDGNVSGNTKNITFSTLKSLIGGGSGSGAVSSVVASGTFGTVTPTTGDVKIGYSITGLTEATSSTLRTDLLLVVDDPSGTPINKKISFTNMMDTSALQASDSQSGFLSSTDWNTFNTAGRGGSPDTSVENGVQFNKKGSFGAVEWLTILNTDISNTGLLLGSPLDQLGGLGATSGKLNILSGKTGQASINLYDATTNEKFVGILGPSNPPEKSYNIALPQGEPKDGQILSVKSFATGKAEMDWTDNASGGGSVVSVGARDPIFSSGGTSPEITMAESTDTNNGWLSSANFATFSKKQPAIILTTDQTSGKATFINNTLNIPAYESSSGGGLKSVGLTMPSAFKVGNSPLIADGTITVGVDGGVDGQFLNHLGEWSTPKAGSGTVTGLTTDKTSGAATLLDGVLNIPIYETSSSSRATKTSFGTIKLGADIELTAQITGGNKGVDGRVYPVQLNTGAAGGQAAVYVPWENTFPTPGGSANSIQLRNSAGGFAGDSTLMFDTNTLTVGEAGGDFGIVVIEGDSGADSGILKLGHSDVTHYVSLGVGETTMSTNYSIDLPTSAPGGNNKILESNSTGILSWIDTPSGGGSSAYKSYEALFSTTDGTVSLVELSNNTGLTFSWVDTRLGNINITIENLADGKRPWVMVNGYGSGVEAAKIQCFFGGISGKNTVVIDILDFQSVITKGNITSGNIEIRIY